MSRWIEVPAHRILELTDEEFDLHFQKLTEDGKPVRFGERTYRIVRKSNGKIFMYPRFHRLDVSDERLVYLEEI